MRAITVGLVVLLATQIVWVLALAGGCQQAEYVEHFRSTPPQTSSTGEGGTVTQSLKTGAADMPEGLIFCRWCGKTFVLANGQWVLWERGK
jgi:hypothetical protein